jgi:PIN domain nuclease of toxin-antitoxin system
VRLLLDTHIFLWFISGDARLPVAWRGQVRNPDNDVYLSVVSLWEVIIKYSLGRLPLPHPPETYVPIQRVRHQIDSLALEEASIQRLATLPSLDRDPFDRMLVCQAMEHQLAIVTVDDAFEGYPVPILERGAAG